MSQQHTHPSLREALSDQPQMVWITAFAATVAFMGIGLVDPILVTIAKDLDATAGQTNLLFSAYLGIQVLGMLITGWTTARYGAKRTLTTGLALIVVATALCAASDSISQMIGYRAVWGLGNALFMATALSVIIASARGGQNGAVLLYEAALGVGLAVGPLLGAGLGGISWRGPFIGTCTLMLIALVACALKLDSDAEPARARRAAGQVPSPLAPIAALRHRGLRLTALGSAFYTAGFFTVLAWIPWILEHNDWTSPYIIGCVFFGWGVCVAIAGVFIAPAVSARWGNRNGSIGAVLGFGMILLLIGLLVDVPALVVALVVISGLLSGILNTLFTGTAMSISTAPRPIASAGYNFLRWMGGAVAATLVSYLADWFGSIAAPMYFAAGGAAIAALLLGRIAERDSTPDVALPIGSDLVGDAAL